MQVRDGGAQESMSSGVSGVIRVWAGAQAQRVQCAGYGVGTV